LSNELLKRFASFRLWVVPWLVRPILQEALRFFRQEKKWWLIPLLISFLILLALVLFTQGPAPLSPFMYSIK
jgi:hypothetical protein